MSKKWNFWLAGMLALMLILAACGGGNEPTSEPAADIDAGQESTEDEAEAGADDATAEEPAEGAADAEEATAEPEEEAAEDDAESETMTSTAEMTETAAITGAAELTGVAGITEGAIMTVVADRTAQVSGSGAATDTVTVTAALEAMQGPSALASTVMGYPIQNTNGDNIGEIQDIVVNLVDGHVLFVTMAYGGGLFQSEQVIPVPASAFTLDAENEVLRLELDEAALEEAPSFDSGWPEMTAEGYDAGEYDAEIYSYWSEQFPDLPLPTDAADMAGTVAKVSDMMGLQVINPQGQNIGEVQDIIINLEQQSLSAAVLRFGGFRLIGSDSFIIPYAGFSLDVSGVSRNNPLGTPVLNLTQNNLASAPSFFVNSLDLSDPNWSEPFQNWWTRMAQTDRGSENPYPLGMTSWQLDSFGDPDANITVITGTRPAITFMLDRYIGTGGCNWFMGVYSAGEDGLLRIQTPATSRTYTCDPVGIMNQENSFTGALANVTEYQIEDGNLVGYTVGDQRMITLAPAESVPLEDTVWTLRFFLGSTQWIPLILDTQITAQISGDQISGSAGCNTYTATLTGQGESVSISDLTVTEQACDTPDGIMNQEERFLAALGSVAGYLHVGGTLRMADETGQPTLIFGLPGPTPAGE